MPIALVSDGHRKIIGVDLWSGTPGWVKIHFGVYSQAGPVPTTGCHEVNVAITIVVSAFKNQPQTIW